MSPIGNLHELCDHIHSPQMVAPSGAAGITVTSNVAAWTLGNFSNDIIAADAVLLPFDIHWVIVSGEDANADYELVLYYGAADTECGRTAFTRTNAALTSHSMPMQTIIIPRKSRVRAKIMDSVGGSAATIKILYHTYDITTS